LALIDRNVVSTTSRFAAGVELERDGRRGLAHCLGPEDRVFVTGFFWAATPVDYSIEQICSAGSARNVVVVPFVI